MFKRHKHTKTFVHWLPSVLSEACLAKLAACTSTCSPPPCLIPVKSFHRHMQQARLDGWREHGEVRRLAVYTFSQYSDAYTWAYSDGLLIKGPVLLTKALNLSLIRSGWMEARDTERKKETGCNTENETSGSGWLRVLPINVDSHLWQCLPYFSWRRADISHCRSCTELTPASLHTGRSFLCYCLPVTLSVS